MDIQQFNKMRITLEKLAAAQLATALYKSHPELGGQNPMDKIKEHFDRSLAIVREP